MIKLIAMDIDNTITSYKNHIPKKNILAIRKACRYGIKIVLASGRPENSILDVARRLDIENNCYAISFNGSRIRELSSNRILFNANLPKELFCELLRLAKQENIFMHTYKDNTIVTEKNNFYSKLEAKLIKFQIEEVEDLAEKINGNDILKVLLLESPKKLRKAAAHIIPQIQHKMSASFSAPFFLDISALGADKGTSLKNLAEQLGINREHIIAFGDNFNDKTMIEYAGIGVVMGNACSEMKKIANVVAPPCYFAGFAKVLEKYL
ncbi:MAG: HAD family phosphatase [Spirochaetales bacterium]|nr:HAD family phosphatase [Spirochaetales bacterium]